MKKYGVKSENGYIYYAARKWKTTCDDSDHNFGTDDINEAYEFMAIYNSRDSFVFEKIK